MLTFQPRRGRVTTTQAAAVRDHGPRLLLGVDQPLVPEQVFGRRAPAVLEIGFGMGEATVAMADGRPDVDVVAVDVHTPGVGALLLAIGERGLPNVRVVHGDAVELLERAVAPGTLAGVRAFFPDPWPKARHRKRRLVQPAFVALASDRLAAGGVLHVATDDAGYAAQVLEVIASEPALHNPYQGTAPRPPGRPVTRFERQALDAGRPVLDIVAIKVSPRA